jgi:hypothetical protein
MQHKRTRKSHVKIVAAVVVVIAVVAGVIGLLGSTDRMTQSEQTKALERAISHAVVSCYAIEGRYPDTLDKVKRDYGLVIDEEKYEVRYDIFASNLMPYITVALKGEN